MTQTVARAGGKRSWGGLTYVAVTALIAAHRAGEYLRLAGGRSMTDQDSSAGAGRPAPEGC